MVVEPYVPIAMAVVAVLAVVTHFWRAKVLLDRWAARSGYTITSAQYRFLRKGPFFLRSGKGNAVYRIAVVDRQGYVRSGYARCGGYWLGMWLTDDVTVEWDDY